MLGDSGYVEVGREVKQSCGRVGEYERGSREGVEGPCVPGTPGSK